MYAASDLDRYLWCPNCRKELKRRGWRWGRLVGLAASLGLAIYFAVFVQPSGRFLILYSLLLVITYTVVSRIVVAVVQGYYRTRGDDAGASETE